MRSSDSRRARKNSHYLIMSDLSNLIKEGSTEKLWDLSAEILTELSRRDGVDFRINAPRDSVEKKVATLNAPPRRSI